MPNSSNTSVSVNITHPMSNPIVYVCVHLVMPCAVAIGIIGNLLSILVFSRREMIKFCVSIFTIVLALSDILLLITSLFNIILPDLLGGPLSDKSVFWCHFHGYFDLLFAALSGYSMVFISVERWFSVWKPFDKAKYVTFKTALIAVASYTTLSLIAFSWFPFTLSYNPQKAEPRQRCELKRPIVYKVFGTISVIFTYIAPFIFLGILNFLIVYRLRARQNTSIHRSMTTGASSANSDPTAGSSSTRKRQRKKTIDRNITFMLIAVAVAFMVMSFPFQIYWFYIQIRKLTELNPTLFTLTQTFRYLNCCCNFFLYSATSSLFRRELREIFQCSTLSKTQHQKELHTQHEKTEITRLRSPSSPPPYSKNVEGGSTIERKKLLTTTNSSLSSMKPVLDKSASSHSTATVENLRLSSTSADPTNGHIVSFKT